MIGELDRKVALEEALQTDDGCGGFVTLWNPVADLWAKIEAAAGRERVPEAERRSRLTIRWRGGVSPSMRFAYDGRVFEIESVRDPDGLARYLVCDCVERGL
jgi:SPP1 family predicted phage head-tail adaptor